MAAAARNLSVLRREFHERISREVLSIRSHRSAKGTPTRVYSNADSYSEVSVDLAARMARRLPEATAPDLKGTALGRVFEQAVMSFVDASLELLPNPGPKRLQVGPGLVISRFAQYAHLNEIKALVVKNPELEATLGGNYLVIPDLVVSWEPLDAVQLNPAISCDEEPCAELSPVRRRSSDEGALPILHASVSCKWTIRSDRVQNTRTEALNLVRNRKGRTPHIVAVTMEPDPGRLEAIALGTGDIDCVYHGALYELRSAAEEAAESPPAPSATAGHRLEMLIRSSRLRDISDLPLDLLA